LRSEKELHERLLRKKFSDSVIEETILFLKEKKFIDDSEFARIWTESRVKKPLGVRRLKTELLIKGIDKAIIDYQLNEIKNKYPEEEIVSQVISQRLSKLKGCDPQKARQRVYGYLLRRGFSPETVIDVLNQKL
jgi:regulatory protein